MTIDIEPKYIMAFVNAALLIVNFLWGYKTGKKAAAREIFGALGVPPGHEISGVSFRKVKQ